MKKRENKYTKYSNVTRTKTTRTFSTAPLSLILEVKGSFDLNTLESLETPVVFQKRIQVTTEDGISHYYVLKQVNCHETAHEYAFLEHQNEWFLSNDLAPVQKVTMKLASPDINKICQYGRTFIYKKVSSKTFAKIDDQVYRHTVVQPSDLGGNPSFRISTNLSEEEKGRKDPQRGKKIQKKRLNFKPKEAPGKIAHNNKPNSCYIAVILNTFRDEPLKSCLTQNSVSAIENTVGENFKKETGHLIRKFQNKIDPCLSDALKLFNALNGNGKLSNTEQQLKVFLEEYFQELSKKSWKL